MMAQDTVSPISIFIGPKSDHCLPLSVSCAERPEEEVTVSNAGATSSQAPTTQKGEEHTHRGFPSNTTLPMREWKDKVWTGMRGPDSV